MLLGKCINVIFGLFHYNVDYISLQEIYPDTEICFFHEGTSVNDVRQGAFGDCYFLAVLAGLAAQPDIMKQVSASSVQFEQSYE